MPLRRSRPSPGFESLEARALLAVAGPTPQSGPRPDTNPVAEVAPTLHAALDLSVIDWPDSRAQLAQAAQAAGGPGSTTPAADPGGAPPLTVSGLLGTLDGDPGGVAHAIGSELLDALAALPGGGAGAGDATAPGPPLAEVLASRLSGILGVGDLPAESGAAKLNISGPGPGSAPGPPTPGPGIAAALAGATDAPPLGLPPGDLARSGLHALLPGAPGQAIMGGYARLFGPPRSPDAPDSLTRLRLAGSEFMIWLQALGHAGTSPGRLAILDEAGTLLASATPDEAGVSTIDLKPEDLGLAAGATVYIDVTSAGVDAATGAAPASAPYELQIGRLDGSAAGRAAGPPSPAVTSPVAAASSSPGEATSALDQLSAPADSASEAAATSAAELALAAVGTASGPAPALAATAGEVGGGGDPTPQVAMQDAAAVEIALVGIAANQAVAAVTPEGLAPVASDGPEALALGGFPLMSSVELDAPAPGRPGADGPAEMPATPVDPARDEAGPTSLAVPSAPAPAIASPPPAAPIPLAEASEPRTADDCRQAGHAVGVHLVAAMLGSLLLPHADAFLRFVPRLRSRLSIPGRPADDGDED